MLDNVLEHIPGEMADAAIRKMRRVLKPDGILAVSVPGFKGYRSDPDHKVYYMEGR